MSDRLAFQENDGDESSFASALETAIDQHWYGPLLCHLSSVLALKCFT